MIKTNNYIHQRWKRYGPQKRYKQL